jgi:uncharacterized protein YdhG (YjbR/CyaY superfamily)
MTEAAQPPAKKSAAKKATAKKTAAKKTPAKKTTAKAPAKSAAKKAAAKKAPARKAGSGFTAAERAAMKDRAGEVTAARRGATKADDVETLLAKIAEMQDEDRALAERVHAIVTSAAPELAPRTWYGMPAYASGGKVVCFFQPAQRFGARYATLGFNDTAHLDDGTMWPTSYAVTDLSDANVAKIEQLVRRAVS